MNWLTVTWCMAASACLTLGMLYLVVWLLDRRGWVHLLFAVAAMGVAGIAVGELLMATAQTPEEYAARLRWVHVPVFVAVVAVVWFVRMHLKTGRLWLAWAVCVGRALVLILNFSVTPNLNYSAITGLRPVRAPGGVMVVVAEGTVSQRTRLGEACSLLLLAYVLDAAVGAWRRGKAGDRRRAVAVGGSMAAFVLLGAGHTALLHAGVIGWPYMISFAFLIPIVAMGGEVSADVVRAARFARELEASEAEVQDQKQQMELAVSAGAMGLWRWDATRDQVWVSERARALLNLEGAEDIGVQRFAGALVLEDRQRLRRALAAAAAGGTECDGEYRMPLGDGATRWIAIRGRIESKGSAKPACIRGVVFDVTARREAEEALRQRTELAHLSRVAMLAELSGSLAHELNQPLTAILSNAQAAQGFLERTPTDLGEVRSILQDIVDEDRRAGEVIRRLRLLFHKGETLYERIDVNELVREALRLMHSELINHEVEVETQLAGGLAEIEGDRVQLQQVLINLMMNASEAMEGCPMAERRLRVRTGCNEDGEVELAVADTGGGIAAEDLERIFEPFHTTKATGMGLGLAICRTIVLAHRGKIWATNNGERGACFHVVLSRGAAA